ncbi:SCO family protein [Phycicoccus sp. M110.8]|uniref:SCO family protein n=1 Tax=Phycicoccus sp. M110.8 TaxID=3075433 RepID=UPI0028FDAC86|nr:SCO family protein [Phycicoccus sp. M110.8]MDU0313138.1 SCO family protein [Phycicoccus sp. M110.8]
MTTSTAGSRGGSGRIGARGRLAPALGLVPAALLLAGCSGVDAAPPRTPPTPTSGTVLDEPLPARIANLPLVDQHGRHFTLASLRGKTVVLGDFLTLCQEVCPMTSVNLRDVAKAVHRDGRSDDIEVVEATVDPHRDTPARLAAYEKLFGAQQDWTLATGGQRPLDALWAYLGVYHQKAREDVSPAPRDWWTGAPLTYDVHHQDVVYVIDARGHARWLDDGTPNTLGEKPSGPMLRFLNNEGRHNLASPTDPSWTVRDVEQAVTYVTGVPLT